MHHYATSFDLSDTQTLLLEETPVIFSYFYNFLTATAKGVTGVETTAMAHVFLAQAIFH